MKVKILIGLSFVFVLLASGCLDQESEDTGAGAQQNIPVKAEILPEAPETPPELPEEPEIQAEAKSFTMVARQWEFEPNTITVNSGDAVTIEITSEDVEHGISIPGLGINQRLEPGETEVIEFVADEPGTYSFFCNVYCGSGHGDMVGQIVVE